MPRTLIHLVSDQTLQNILPILALEPDRVLQVMSKDTERFRKPALNTRRAVEVAARRGFRMPAEWPDPVAVGVDSPSIEQTRKVVAGLLQEGPKATVNYTGGTKNMSIGAWLAARDASAPTLYCDTPREFVSGGTADLQLPVALQAVAKKLNVEVILASQGLMRGEQWRREGFSSAELVFGDLCLQMTQTHGNQFRQYRHTLFSHASSRGGKVNAADVRRASTTPVPAPANKDFVPFLDQAVQMRFLRKNGNEWFYNLRPQLPSKTKIKELSRLAMGISGRAFEAYVASKLERSPIFTDHMANIKPAGSHPEEHGFGESDFLAYAPGSLALTLISCKCSPPGLEHLEALLSRKAKFGGLFARTLLCVEFGVDDNRQRVLRKRCESLGIACAIGEEIPRTLGA